MDANEYYLNQHQAQEATEDARQEAIIERSNDIMLELMHSEGDFAEAMYAALETAGVMTALHEKFIEGRRMDLGVELCEKIDEELGAMGLKMAKGEFE